MLDRLASVVDRYDELNNLLSDPEVVADYTQVEKYAREQAAMREVVDLARQYRKLSEDLSQVKDIIRGETEEELVSMAKDEQVSLEKNLILVDDYGHHPSEMTCSIDTVRQVWPQRRLIMVFQPHRYTRNRDLLLEFAAVLGQTDVLILCEVFAAGETPIEGAGSEALAALIEKTDRTEIFLVSGPMEATQVAKSIVGEGDVLMVQGAGDVGSVSTRFQENNYA